MSKFDNEMEILRLQLFFWWENDQLDQFQRKYPGDTFGLIVYRRRLVEFENEMPDMLFLILIKRFIDQYLTLNGLNKTGETV